VREPDYAAHPPLERVLTLPADWPRSEAVASDVYAAWSRLLGDRPVALVRSVERARELLLRAADVQPGEPIGLPANATRRLVEAIKHHGARPLFLDVGPDLSMRVDRDRLAAVRIAWSEPVGGLPTSPDLPGVTTWIDHADTLPARARPRDKVTLWGLRLSSDPSQSGALVTFGSSTLLKSFEALLAPGDLPDLPSALAQCSRLGGDALRQGLAHGQDEVVRETRRGLREAAGLPLLEGHSAALPHHLAVRIPDESDPSTFYAYVRGENTPVRWLPEVRPLHHAALRPDQAANPLSTAANLARWLLVPVGPDYTREEIVHAVLGIVKAAEYLGVRWRTAPTRAAQYARLLDDMYGPDHDAFRPVFATPSPSGPLAPNQNPERERGG
jgi:hypothetical protein